jgi:ribosome-associated protein
MAKKVRFKGQTNYITYLHKRNHQMVTEFKIEGEYIELIQLLKVLGIAATGGHAKFIVDEGEVFRNGEVELRKRAKLVPGDVIEMEDFRVKLIA